MGIPFPREKADVLNSFYGKPHRRWLEHEHPFARLLGGHGISKVGGSCESVIAQVKKHKLQGRVAAFTTGCEPSTVKAGRLVEEQSVAEHHGCHNHRLECTTGIVFNGPGVLERPWRSHG